MSFKQLCVWPGTLLEKSQEQEFVNFMKEGLGSRVQLAEVTLTLPDYED